MMASCARAALVLCLLHAAAAIKVKTILHSEEDSGVDEEAPAPVPPSPPPPPPAADDDDDTVMPFIKTRKHKPKAPEYDDERPTTAAPKHAHPNDMFFPLVYRQTHINSMFKFEGNWYTWSIEKQPDGTKNFNYYYCNDEPKHCDDIGWEHIEAPPKCAFQIDSLTYDDHACTRGFGSELRTGGGGAGDACNGGEQTKVNDIVRSCGSRVRSLWKFSRAGRRPPAAAKPADVNSLICEDEDECFVTVEYRIHHDRITFSLHEPTRGQTFKSALKRDLLGEEPVVAPVMIGRHRKQDERDRDHDRKRSRRGKAKAAEGKGIAKKREEPAWPMRHTANKKNRINDDISDATSE